MSKLKIEYDDNAEKISLYVNDIEIASQPWNLIDSITFQATKLTSFREKSINVKIVFQNFLSGLFETEHERIIEEFHKTHKLLENFTFPIETSIRFLENDGLKKEKI